MKIQKEYLLQEKQNKCIYITKTIRKIKIGQNKKNEPFSNRSNRRQSVMFSSKSDSVTSKRNFNSKYFFKMFLFFKIYLSTKFTIWKFRE